MESEGPVVPLDYATPQTRPARRRSRLAMVAAGLVLLSLMVGGGLLLAAKYWPVPGQSLESVQVNTFGLLVFMPALGAILGVAALLRICERRTMLKGLVLAVFAIVGGAGLVFLGIAVLVALQG